MTFVSCSVPERFVNPLFEVFDGGDFVLSSYRDIEEPFARMRVFLDPAAGGEKLVPQATQALKSALEIVGLSVPIETGEIADEDWKFAYRRHFKIEPIGRRILTVPEWEVETARREWGASGREMIVLDPGMAFGTGKHETTRACIEYIDELFQPSAQSRLPLSTPSSFLDMGSGSGILSIAAAKLGCPEVVGFDVDAEAVDASRENAERNGVKVDYFRFALGRGRGAAAPQGRRVPFDEGPYDVVAANILGPLLIRFADEITPFAKDRLILSGILTELYAEVRSTYEMRGFREISNRMIGEWTTGLYGRVES